MSSTLTSPQFAATMAALVTKTCSDGTVLTDGNKLTNSEVPSDATIWFHEKYTVTAGSDQQLDLSGTLTDQLGQSAVFTKVYGFLIRNLATSGSNNLQIGGSNFAAWLGASNDLVVIGPLGMLFVTSPVNGYTVTNSTADILKIANPGGANIDCVVGIIGK